MKLILIASSLLALAHGGQMLCGTKSTYHDTHSSNNCASDSTTLQYKSVSPPAGQTSWPIVVSSVTATVNGVDAAANGGLDLNKHIVVTVKGTNNFGAVTNPKLDVEVLHCTTGFLFDRTCKWRDIAPINAALQNQNPCLDASGVSIDDCHLSKGVGPTTLVLNIDLSTGPLAGLLNALISHKTYYELVITLREAASSNPTTLIKIAADDFVL